MKTEDEISTFWKGVEEEHHGKVQFKTSALFLGKSRGPLVNIFGILYVVGDHVVFENFEKGPDLFQVLLKRNKKFEKHKVVLSVEQILDVKEVTKRSAHRCLDGLIADSETSSPGFFDSLFASGVRQIRLRSGESLFFDMVDPKNFDLFTRSPRHVMG
jgi:hypothetical protein